MFLSRGWKNVFLSIFFLSENERRKTSVTLFKGGQKENFLYATHLLGDWKYKKKIQWKECAWNLNAESTLLKLQRKET